MCLFFTCSPSLPCSLELDSQGQGHMDFLDGLLCHFLSRSDPPQLYLGCCVRMFTNLVKSWSAGGYWSPRRGLRGPRLVIWTLWTWWPWVWAAPWELVCTSWLEKWLCMRLDQQLSSASLRPECLLFFLGSAMQSWQPGHHAPVLPISTAMSLWENCALSSLAGTSSCPLSQVRWWDGWRRGLRSENSEGNWSVADSWGLYYPPCGVKWVIVEELHS